MHFFIEPEIKPTQMAISWSGSSADRSSGGFKSSPGGLPSMGALRFIVS